MPAIRLARLAPLALTAMLAAPAAQAYEIGFGYDGLHSPNTPIEGLARLYIGRDIGHGISFGQSVYSAAKGDGGGAFFWGIEGIKRFALTDRLSLNASLFLGGGGGAGVVTGNGFMTRAGLGIGYAISDRVDFELGAAYVKIDGAPIDNAAINAGLTWHIGARAGQNTGSPLAMPLRSISIRGGKAVFSGSRDRKGNKQPDLSLAGAEASFLLGGGNEFVFSGDGAASGGEGYMQIFGSLRHRVPVGMTTLYAQAGFGFGGGGNVDTGGGLLLDAGVGMSVPLSEAVDLDLSVGKTVAPDGNFNGTVARVSLSRVFRRSLTSGPTSTTPTRWIYSLGISAQHPNATFRKPGSGRSGTPVMQESSIDMFLTPHVYLTGNAQTALSGDVSGYAIGMLGLGWRQPLSDRWAVSIEGRVGAAGGGNVNASGGLIGGVSAEIDYALNDKIDLSLGVGKLKALRNSGMAPTTVTAGLKFPFTTH